MSSFLRSFVPAQGQARHLATMQFASSIADGAYYAGIAVYLLTIVGLGAIEVATALSLTASAGFVGGLCCGFAADRVRAKGLLLTLVSGAAVATAAYALVDSLLAFACAAALHRICQKGAAVIRAATLPRIVDEPSRVVVRGQLQALYNTGLALGALLAGIAIVVDTREAFQALFLVGAACHLAACLPATRLDAPDDIGFTLERGAPFLSAGVLTDRRFLGVFGLHAVMLLNVPIIDLVLPFWVIAYTNAPSWIVPVVFALNTVAAILFQVGIARRVTTMETAVRAYRLAGLLLLLSFVAFAATAFTEIVWVACALLLLGASIQVVGEMLQLSAGWHVSYALAPPSKHGQYQGVFHQGMTVAETVGPLLQTAVIAATGFLGFVLFGGVFLLCGVALGPVVRRAAEPKPART